jgi:hypothetical protein
LTVPAYAISLYESLRNAVVQGHARPEGVGAIVYHGLFHGLWLLSQMPPAPVTPVGVSPGLPNVRTDRAFLHLLANMVLRTQEEVTHVY